MKKEGLLQIFLYLWLIGSIIAFILQFFFPNFTSNSSSWNYSEWQREIALWNIAMIFAILYTLIIKTIEHLKFLTLILTMTSLILGTNHAVSLIISQRILLTHLLGTVFNYLGVIIGFYAFLINKKI